MSLRPSVVPILLALALGCLACGGATTAPTPSTSTVARPSALPVTAAASTAIPEPTETWRVVNLMPSWWDYWQEAETLEPAERLELFEERIVSAHPELFAPQVVSRDPTAPFDRERLVADFLDGVEPLLPAMRRVSESIEEDLPAHRATFMEAFADFDWDGTVYFTISLDAFDGAVRPIDGEPQLLFGVDKIARIHGDQADLAPLFHHELFHILHLVEGQPFDPDAKNRMYQALWAEGLAVYVAHRLNPGASWQALVLNDEMVARGEATLPVLATEMIEHLDSSDITFYRDWFRSAGRRKDIPVRVGYFLGYRVAKMLGESRSLAELARLADPELRSAIEVALRQLAGDAAK